MYPQSNNIGNANSSPNENMPSSSTAGSMPPTDQIHAENQRIPSFFRTPKGTTPNPKSGYRTEKPVGYDVSEKLLGFPLDELAKAAGIPAHVRNASGFYRSLSKPSGRRPASTHNSEAKTWAATMKASCKEKDLEIEKLREALAKRDADVLRLRRVNQRILERLSDPALLSLRSALSVANRQPLGLPGEIVTMWETRRDELEAMGQNRDSFFRLVVWLISIGE